MTNQPLMIALPILGSAAAVTTMTAAPVSGDFGGLLSTTVQQDTPFVSPMLIGSVKSLPDQNPTEPTGSDGLIVVTGKPVLPSVFVVKVEAEAINALPAADVPALAAPPVAAPEMKGAASSKDVLAEEKEDQSDPAESPPLPDAAISLLQMPLVAPAPAVANMSHTHSGEKASAETSESDAAPTITAKIGSEVAKHEALTDQITDPSTPRIRPDTMAFMPGEKPAVAPDAQVASDGDPVIVQASAPVLSERTLEVRHAFSASLSIHSPRFGEELGIAIARHVARGEDAARETMTVRLDPPEHGRIEVSLSFEDGGPLRAVVAASHSTTLDLLRRDSADLSRALAQAGVSTDAQSFSFSAQTQDGQRGRHQTQPQFATAEVDGPEPDPDPQDYRKLRTRGSLNLIA
jgi:flagellar hook-length control protein FliK